MSSLALLLHILENVTLTFTKTVSNAQVLESIYKH